MNKFIASSLLTAFLSSKAFAGSGGPYMDGDGVKASFDRMLNHRPAASVHVIAADQDVLQEAFAAALWSGAHATLRQAVATASSTPAGSDGSYMDGVKASFDRMLNHQPEDLARSTAADRDVLQEAFTAALWSGAYASVQPPVAGASADPGSDESPRASVLIGRVQ